MFSKVARAVVARLLQAKSSIPSKGHLCYVKGVAKAASKRHRQRCITLWRATPTEERPKQTQNDARDPSIVVVPGVLTTAGPKHTTPR